MGTKEKIKALEQSGEVETIGANSEIWLGVPLKIEGKVTGVIVIQSYTDENAYDESDMELLEFISHQVSILIERKKDEQDLIMALDKATESDKLKSAFLAAMSHELRTPLNAVIGFSDVIDKTYSMEEILKMTRLINQSGNHLLRIIEDIFDISMIEAGEINVNNKAFDLVPLLHRIHELVLDEQDTLRKHHLEITYRPPQHTKELVLISDEGKIKQILLNLLKNALKFTPDGSVEYGWVHEVREDTNYLNFYVKDTGIGISQDVQEFIFDPFRQAEETHTRQFGGTGLGLTISKKLTNILGGKIWVESREGVGSTFFFTIPYDRPEISKPVEPVKDAGEIQKHPGKTILIVEDEDSNYEFLNVILSRLEIDTLHAENGHAAIDLCLSNPGIDLVLMDIKMPVMNGYEATKLIKQERPDLPIIAQTAHAIFGDKEKALEAGCDDYISKPIIKEDLYQLISKYLD
ncbi:MAG: response regulator [Bacteroidia bacterium]|nr:response regulator [Bacteroidia bacterium]